MHMESINYESLTNDELLVEKKKLKKAKLMHAFTIGFLAGILIFGVVAWFLSPERKVGFLIPMIFPAVIMYKTFKKRNAKPDLEGVLKNRNL